MEFNIDFLYTISYMKFSTSKLCICRYSFLKIKKKIKIFYYFLVFCTLQKLNMIWRVYLIYFNTVSSYKWFNIIRSNESISLQFQFWVIFFLWKEIKFWFSGWFQYLSNFNAYQHFSYTQQFISIIYKLCIWQSFYAHK